MSDSASRPAFNHYAVLHRGPGGKGTGYSIVTARNTNMARQYVWLHLSNKEEGYLQCGCSSLLEVMPLDESMFADFAVPADTLGVHCEYDIGEDAERKPAIVYLAT